MLSIALCILGLNACSDVLEPRGPAESAQPDAVTRVTISPSTVRLNPGAELTFTAAVTDGKGKAIEGSVTWRAEGGVIDGKGRFRILVKPTDEEPWPAERFLRQGVRANGWVMLDRVTLGYEIWRQLNGFPPALGQDDSVFSGKEDKTKVRLPK